jgi:hypothetical protein
MKDYYPNLRKNLAVRRYFENFQEPLWEKVKIFFEKKERHLCIPQRKTGPGRYVQFPKSQQLIRWHELVEYADVFIKINLHPDRIFSFDAFCDRVHIDYNYLFSSGENEIIRRIVFSFYNRWDGRPTSEIRTQRFKPQDPGGEATGHKGPEITLKFSYETVFISKDGRKISEDELLNSFTNKLIIPFIFNEDYEEWEYTTKILQTSDRLLVLINKSHKISDCFVNKKCDDLEMKYFHIYIFESRDIDDKVANFVNLDFDKREVYTIIGEIKVRSNNKNNVIGYWYDFALPRIKINLPSSTRMFIDSNEIAVDKNQIDLSNIFLKHGNEQYRLVPGKHSFKCSGVSPAYFFIEECKSAANISLNHGWIISTNNLRPVKKGENPNVIGLKIKKANEIKNDINLRPFLNQIEYLQNRPLERLINGKLKTIEKRRNYGC